VSGSGDQCGVNILESQSLRTAGVLGLGWGQPLMMQERAELHPGSSLCKIVGLGVCRREKVGWGREARDHPGALCQSFPSSCH
jgi:hypothetical protein